MVPYFTIISIYDLLKIVSKGIYWLTLRYAMQCHRWFVSQASRGNSEHKDFLYKRRSHPTQLLPRCKSGPNGAAEGTSKAGFVQHAGKYKKEVWLDETYKLFKRRC
ncbi:hypothetical protein CEXT_687561 [Caerostris extrusa]|uniref:Uncharacterized protein n=1 Tax=Caerostris extrusa TaxID=172846 RepID=A0AAV4T1N7_CAEEX|nr:hypothetical protein CEXT_687561 [Caerostris extrusa]